jgi:hypothetical protein
MIANLVVMIACRLRPLPLALALLVVVRHARGELSLSTNNDTTTYIKDVFH